MPVHIATTVFPSWCMTPLWREPLMLLKFSQIEHTSMPLCSPGQIYNSWMPVTGSYWWEGHTCWHIETLYLARVRSKQTHCSVAFLQVLLSQMLFSRFWNDSCFKHRAIHLQYLQCVKDFPVLQRDPFGTAFSLSEQDCLRVHNQSIPSLAQFLQMASHSGSLVLFDLHKPPHGHPYSQSYINVTLQVVHISSSQVSIQNTIKIWSGFWQQG